MGLTAGLKALLPLIPCFLHFSSVRSHSLQNTPLQLIGLNGSIPSSLLSKSVPLAPPSLPPGIGLSVDYDFNKRLSALGIYLNAFEVIDTVQSVGWDGKPVGPDGLTITARGPGEWEAGYGVEVVIKNSQRPENPLQLNTSFVVLAIWQAMEEISTHDLYYETVLTLKQHDRKIGTITIKKPLDEATTNLTSQDPDRPHLINSTIAAGPTYPRGAVRDPQYPAYEYIYVYRPDKPIARKDVFMLGLVAQVAQHATAIADKVHLANASPTRRCTAALAYGSGYNLEYLVATRMLKVLFYSVVLELDEFGEMAFGLDTAAITGWIVDSSPQVVRNASYGRGAAS